MDREKVIDYIESKNKRAEQSDNDIWLECVEVKLLRDALALLKRQEDALEQMRLDNTDLRNCNAELLKEQEAVVRCNDCKHNTRCEIAFGCNGNREWYCADGERAE
jgi:hypothetical protein